MVNPYLGAQPIVVDQDYKNPRATIRLGAGVERELISGVTVAADFTYVKTDYLQRNRELNLGVRQCRATPTRRCGRSFRQRVQIRCSARFSCARPALNRSTRR